jgi:hypothetical protein
MPPPYPYPVAETGKMQALVFFLEFQKGAQKSNSFFKLTTTVSAAVSAAVSTISAS